MWEKYKLKFYNFVNLLIKKKYNLYGNILNIFKNIIKNHGKKISNLYLPVKPLYIFSAA